MDPMQADALRRANQMQSNVPPFNPDIRTSQNYSSTKGQNNPKSEQHKSSKQEHPNPQPTPVKEAVIRSNRGDESAPSLFADKEKLLVLALILILSTEENSDPALTLALLYLII